MYKIKNSEELRNSGIERIAELDLDKAKKRGYVCPACGNGSGEDGTGATIFINNRTNAPNLHCHKCKTNYNALELVAEIHHLNLHDGNDLEKAAKKVAEINGCNVEYEAFSSNTHKTTCNKIKADSARNSGVVEVYARLEESRQNIDKLKEFVNADKWRGLLIDFIKELGWGFLSDYSHPKNPYKKFPAVIIPNIKNGILARQVNGNEKSNVSPSAPTIINLVDDSTIPIIVTEGAINGASLAYATKNKYPIISIGGTGGVNLFIDYLQDKYQHTELKPKIVILFDNDKSEAGLKAAVTFVAKLIELHFPAIYKFIDERKDYDINDILQNEGEKVLADKLESILTDAQSEFESVMKDIEENIRVDKSIAEWVESHGDIAPAVMEKLKTARQDLLKINADNITLTTARDSKVLHSAALCKFYDFYIDAYDNFMQIVKESATTKDVTSEIKNAISTNVKNIKTEYLNFVKKKNIEKYAKNRADKIEKLEALHNQPQSAERDSEIIKIIKNLCKWNKKTGKIENSQANAELFFKYDPVIRDLIGYEEFKQETVLLKQPTWRNGNFMRNNWQDSDDSQLRYYIRQTYSEFNHESVLADCIVHFSRLHSFHVVKNYLENLPKWDKVERADSLAIKFLHADNTEYTKTITENFLLAAIARIYYPGCNYQTALVLQGEQGIGKSRLLAELGGQWFGTVTDKLDDPHAQDAIIGLWVVELAEFAGARKAEINTAKAFISSNADTRRLPYDKRPTTILRQCVLAITCNDSQFLRDETGNRRYLIISCHSPKNDSSSFDNMSPSDIKSYFAQVWAEMLYKFKLKTNNLQNFDDNMLRLPVHIQKQAEEITEHFTVDNGLEAEIVAFLDIPIPQKVLWNNLTREQRRKFFIENKFYVQDSDIGMIRARLNDSAQSELDALINDINEPHPSKKLVGRVIKDENGKTTAYEFYGTDFRETICAAEIQNEFFSINDKRKNANAMQANEILSRLHNWKQGKRQQHYPVYGDQRRIFYRTLIDDDKVNNVFDNVADSDFFSGTEIDENDLPF